MRYVAVTEGDKTEAEAVFGVQVNTWGVNDLVAADERVHSFRVGLEDVPQLYGRHVTNLELAMHARELCEEYGVGIALDPTRHHGDTSPLRVAAQRDVVSSPVKRTVR